jgi:outer membrane lipoprotein carrier protein
MIMTVIPHVYSQTRSSEETGSELIAKASQRIRSFENIRAEFIYIMENDLSQMREELAGIIYASGNKFHMTLGENIFVSDGESVWIYMEELNEIHISYAKDAELGISPVAILEDMEKNFRARFVKQERVAGKMADIIDLVPNEPHAFYKYRVGLQASDQTLLYTIAYDRHGGTYTYDIKEIRSNIKTDPGLFSFNTSQYPGIEIIDLR